MRYSDNKSNIERRLLMEYRKFGNDYVVRIDRGEEVLESISSVCKKENIRLGTVSGIGALNSVTLGVFDYSQFKFLSETYTGAYEIASCSGNISEMNGDNYLHIHMTVGNVSTDEVHAGHLTKAIVSLTGEFFLHKLDGSVDREYSPEVGLNVWRF